MRHKIELCVRKNKQLQDPDDNGQKQQKKGTNSFLSLNADAFFSNYLFDLLLPKPPELKLSVYGV